MLSAVRILTVAVSLAAVATAFTPIRRSSNPRMHKRDLTGQTVAFACFGGGGDCECPLDTNGEQGVLVNVFPGFQCAYPDGACTWDDAVCQSHRPLGRSLTFWFVQTGALVSASQGNCPTAEACTKDHGCICPADSNGDAGVLIFQFTGYQCEIGRAHV